MEENEGLKSANNEFSADLEEVGRRHATNAKMVEVLMSRASDLRNLVSGFVSNFNDHFLELSELKTVHAKLTEKLLSVQKKQEKLVDIIQQRESVIQSLSKQMEEREKKAEKELAEAENKISELLGAAEVSEKKLEFLENVEAQNKELQLLYVASQEQVQDSSELISRLEKRCNELLVSETDLRQALISAKNKISSMEERPKILSDNSSYLETISQMKEEHRKALAKKEEEIENLKRQIPGKSVSNAFVRGPANVWKLQEVISVSLGKKENTPSNLPKMDNANCVTCGQIPYGRMKECVRCKSRFHMSCLSVPDSLKGFSVFLFPSDFCSLNFSFIGCYKHKFPSSALIARRNEKSIQDNIFTKKLINFQTCFFPLKTVTLIFLPRCEKELFEWEQSHTKLHTLKASL